MKLKRTFEIKYFYNLKVDFCKMFYFESSIPSCVAIHKSSFDNYPGNPYILLGTDEISNLNRTTIYETKGKAKFEMNGIYKLNIYTTFTKYYFGEKITKNQFEHTISHLCSDFYGYKSKSFKTGRVGLLRHLSKCQELLRSNEQLIFPIRVETTISSTSFSDLDNFSKHFISQANITMIDTEVIKTKVRIIIEHLNRILISAKGTINDCYRFLMCEVYFVEFIIRGGKNPHMLPRDVIHTLNSITFNDIQTPECFFRLVIINQNVLIQIKALDKLIQFSKKINNRDTTYLHAILTIPMQEKQLIPQLIVDTYFTEIFEISKYDVTKEYMICENTKISLYQYVKKHFSTEITFLSGLVFSSMVKVCLTEKIYSVEELSIEIYNCFVSNTNKFLLKDDIIVNEKKNKTNIFCRIDYRHAYMSDADECFTLLLKEIKFINENEQRKKRVPMTDDEKLRLVYGFEKYKLKSYNVFSLIAKDISLGFTLTRDNTQLKDIYRNMIKRTDYKDLQMQSMNYSLSDFSIDMHIANLSRFNLCVTDNGFKLYKELLDMIFDKQHTVYDENDNMDLVSNTNQTEHVESTNDPIDNITCDMVKNETDTMLDDKKQNAKFAKLIIEKISIMKKKNKFKLFKELEKIEEIKRLSTKDKKRIEEYLIQKKLIVKILGYYIIM